MNDDEKEAALRQRGSDLFDEMSIAGLMLLGEEHRQQLRKLFATGFVCGWAEGHFTGMSEAITLMKRGAA